MVKKQNYVIWIQTVSKVYIKTDDIYKDIAEDVIDLILQIMNKTEHCQKEKIKK